jgi:GH24 family phage-related lysozyme (muramidase)
MDYFDHILVSEILHDEGYRLKSYKDKTGLWTIGVGHLLGGEYTFANLTWTPEQVLLTLMQDLNSAVYYVRKYIYTFEQLSDNRQRVLISMMFNLGPNRFAGFTNTIAAINRLDYYRAKVEMLDSKWAREDVPNRANRLANRWMAG